MSVSTAAMILRMVSLSRPGGFLLGWSFVRHIESGNEFGNRGVRQSNCGVKANTDDRVCLEQT